MLSRNKDAIAIAIAIVIQILHRKGFASTQSPPCVPYPKINHRRQSWNSVARKAVPTYINRQLLSRVHIPNPQFHAHQSTIAAQRAPRIAISAIDAKLPALDRQRRWRGHREAAMCELPAGAIARAGADRCWLLAAEDQDRAARGRQ